MHHLCELPSSLFYIILYYCDPVSDSSVRLIQVLIPKVLYAIRGQIAKPKKTKDQKKHTAKTKDQQKTHCENKRQKKTHCENKSRQKKRFQQAIYIFNIIKEIGEQYPFLIYNAIIACGCTYKQFILIKSQLNLTKCHQPELLAARYGNLSILHKLCKTLYNINESELMNKAAHYGQEKIVKWLENITQPSNVTIIFAIMSGNIKLVKYLINTDYYIVPGVDDDYTTYTNMAAQLGFNEISKFLENTHFVV